MTIVIATCRAYPELSTSNATLAGALVAAGSEVAARPWNGAPLAEFAAARAVLLRQTWDYTQDPGGYAAWAVRAETLGARLINRAGLAVWNNDKRHLIEMAAAGIATPETRDLSREDDPAAVVRALGGRVVLKPAFGGSGRGVRLASPETVAETLAGIAAEMPGASVMAQEFCPEIAAGEWSLVFVAGMLSHAILSRPAEGEFRTNSAFGPDRRQAEAPPEAAAAGRAILDWLGETPLIARIDGVMRGPCFLCTELELTDPDIALHLAEGSAERLARAILEALG